ncbi:MAG: SAVED domain-containing protein [bacterium]|nr:SAVED domain-containing protein [bacterium]
MKLPDPKESTIIQTHEPPMTELDGVRDHAAAISALVSWNSVGVLIDDGPQAIVIVLLDGERVVGVARFCLPTAQSVQALQAYDRGTTGPMQLRCWQGHTITSEQAQDLCDLTNVWKASSSQRNVPTIEDWRTFFDRIDRNTRERGRGAGISTATRHQVLLDAHGRCMFEGCGADLTEDPVTRVRGNFATLAHNVASSEGGTRGVLYLSGALADDPENILLLCETHHRLIDKVAKADYPAGALSTMRRRFCENATELLDGLALAPTPAYCVAWPVHRQRIALPSQQQIARALKPIGARLDGPVRTVNYNEALLRRLEGGSLWSAICTAVDQSAGDILQQTHDQSYRAALFAMGLMPALIALGAKLGNKCDITPMLRFRENGLWYWPVNEPRGEFYSIKGLNQLSDREGEICLLLGLTAVPKSMNSTAKSLGRNIVSVIADTEYLGNGALGHPYDGASFRQRMQELLHRLRDTHGAHTVHVLPCASNAASVFFGQAFDSYHPDLVIYDFVSQGNGMVPRLHLTNVDNECKVKTAAAD